MQFTKKDVAGWVSTFLVFFFHLNQTFSFSRSICSDDYYNDTLLGILITVQYYTVKAVNLNMKLLNTV